MLEIPMAPQIENRESESECGINRRAMRRRCGILFKYRVCREITNTEGAAAAQSMQFMA